MLGGPAQVTTQVAPNLCVRSWFNANLPYHFTYTTHMKKLDMLSFSSNREVAFSISQ
jgi:hypothetical protein